jgi:hypothetical protein
MLHAHRTHRRIAIAASYLLRESRGECASEPLLVLARPDASFGHPQLRHGL